MALYKISSGYVVCKRRLDLVNRIEIHVQYEIRNEMLCLFQRWCSIRCMYKEVRSKESSRNMKMVLLSAAMLEKSKRWFAN